MTARSSRHPELVSGSKISTARKFARLCSWIPAFAGITMMFAAPAGAQTFAIVGGTVALGDGSEPIENGMVVVRDGRILAAGNVRMKLPANTRVIDATGKWVTPGIVGGFTRLGLSEVDLSVEGSEDLNANGPFSAAIDVVLWNRNPFDTYARPERVWVDGALLYYSGSPNLRPVSDFELGQPGEGDVK